MTQAIEIINNIHLTNQLIDLMRNANKAIMEIYNDPIENVITKKTIRH